MERIILVIQAFCKLIKLEHHRSFLEFCIKTDTIPIGLQIKKTFSCHVPVSDGLKESW